MQVPRQQGDRFGQVNRPRRRMIWGGLAVALAALLLGALLATLALAPSRDRFDFLFENFRIEDCLASRLAQGAATPPTETDVVTCYNTLRMQGKLNEFQVRRVAFQTRHVADIVIMWMVVVLTLSGVILAAYQIVASSELRPDEGAPDSEMSIERGRLFVRSSVAGLFILIVSFAFFFVYVRFIYQLDEIGAQLERVESINQPLEEDLSDYLEGGGMLLDPDLSE